MKLTVRNRSGAKQTIRLATPAALILLAARTMGATYTWDGGGPNDLFENALNWAGNAVPVNNGTAEIVFAGTTRLNPILNTNPDWLLHSITFASGAGAFNFTFSNWDLNTGTGGTGIGAGGIVNNDNSLQTISALHNQSESIDSYLYLTSNQAWNAAAGALSIDAKVQISTGLTLQLGGGFGKTLGRAISGGGSIELTSGGTNFAHESPGYSGTVTVNPGAILYLGESDATGKGHLVLNGGQLQTFGGSSILNELYFGAGTSNTIGGSSGLYIYGKTRVTNGQASLNIANSGGVAMLGGLQVLSGNTLNRTGTGTLSIGDTTASPAGAFTEVAGTLNLTSGTTLMGVNSRVVSGGVVNVTGAGTAVSADANLTVYEGGSFNINPGTSFALQSGAPGTTLLVNGGTFNSAGSVSFEPGTALSVQNGGQALFTGNFITPAGLGFDVTGHGSLFHTTGDLLVQSGVTSSVTVDGDLSTGGRLVISNNSAGTMLVDGAGSKITIAGSATPSVIGSGGNGRLMMSAGATGTIGNTLLIGNSPANSTGEVSLYTGARLAVNADLSIGSFTTAGTRGEVMIDGLGSKLSVNGPGSVLTIGAASGSTATLTVGDGATLAASLSAGGGTVLNKTGTLIINGGTAELGPLTRAPGSQIQFNSGSLSYGGDLTVNNTGLLGGSTTLDAARTLTLTGTTTIEPESGIAVTGGSLTTGSLSSGGVVSVSSGSVSLTSGPLTLASGDGIIPSTFTVSGTGSLHLNSSGALAGNGGTLTLNGGTLDAGSGPLTAGAGGAIHYSGNTLINGGTLSGPGTHLIGSGGARLNGGTLAAGSMLSQNAAATLTNFSIAGTVFSGQPLALAGNTSITGLLNLDFSGSTASGPVTVSSGGLLDLNTGTFTAGALLTALSGGSFDIGPGTTLTANGGVLVDGGTLTRASGGTFNPSFFNLTGGGHAVFQGGLDYDAAHTTTVSGTGTLLEVAGGQLLVDSGGTMNVLGGAQVLVDGRLVASNVQTGAIIVDGQGSLLSASGTGGPVSVIGSQAAGPEVKGLKLGWEGVSII